MFSVLFAYELGTESYDRFLIMDPESRAKGLTYPRSWLEPDNFLMEIQYMDSSLTYARWDQLFSIDRTANWYYNLSADITVKYIPYSFPHRWGVALEFLDYRGPGSSKRSDAVIHYRHKNGNIRYYHTNNDQLLTMRTSENRYLIRSHGLTFDHNPAKMLKLLGGISYNRIDQSGGSIRKDDTYHAFVELRYRLAESILTSLALENRYFHNNGQESAYTAVRPGIRYTSGLFSTHLGYRIAAKQSLPIAHIRFDPEPFHLEAYAKVREPLVRLQQPGHSYLGIKGGVNLDKNNHRILADADLYYDIIRRDAGGDPVNRDFYGIHAKTEYRFKLKAMEVYGRGSYHRNIDPQPGYYYPEISTLTAGYTFRAGLVEGKLVLFGDLNAQLIIHDDPLKVRFDPSKLIYMPEDDVQAVADWRINLKLTAQVQTFRIGVDLSTPLHAGKDLTYYLYEGIYTSSDFFYGNTFYAAITIDWLWWK